MTVDALKKAARSVWPILLLCVINVGTFRKHFVDKATFPWDFVGGYHSQAFGWFDNGSIFHPPAWFPWTNLGFPAFLALQSGAWYLPLALMHAVGIPYTIHAATIFQALHVLFGAIGVYFLSRRVGCSVVVGLIAAIGFHYSSTFYSNQEHVDIVRAVAWMPWLLYVLHPAGFLKSRWNILLGALVLSQLLICGYPGNIVSTAYACVVWVGMLMWSKPHWYERRRYLFEVILTVIAGVLIAMPKWLPLIMNGAAGITVQHLAPASPVAFSQLLTLLTPYNVSALPGDRTMRSLWLPLTCIWGMAFTDLRSRTARIGVIFIFLALFMGFLVPRVAHLSGWLPGLQVSRFAASDWRPVLQLGLIFISLVGWTRLLARQCSLRAIFMGTSICFALGLGVVGLALNIGFEPRFLWRVLLMVCAMAALTVSFPLALSLTKRPNAVVIGMGVLLIVATIGDGYQYQRSQTDEWRASWNAQVEHQTFGADVESMIQSSRALPSIARRPARLLLGKDTKSALAKRNTTLYNRCWYEHSYCVFGYDNLRMSEPHATFLASLSKPDGDQLLRFVQRPQQLLALVPGSKDSVPQITGSDDAAVIGDSSEVTALFEGYGSDTVRYRITSMRAVKMVENEIWWPGWKVNICNSARCSGNIDTVATSQGLRSWNLEKGTWTVRLQFVPPSAIPGYLCVLFGLLLGIATPSFYAIARRRKLRKPLSVD